MQRFTGLSVIVVITLCGGCSDTAPDQPDLGTVHGTVTLNGDPLSGVTVYFKPENGRMSMGKADLLGNYKALYKTNNIVGGATVVGFSGANNDQSASYARKGNGLAAIGLTYNGINALVGGEHDVRGYSSNHVGGAHFVLADGSVHFISENIDYVKGTVGAAGYFALADSTFQKLALRDDGKVLGEF